MAIRPVTLSPAQARLLICTPPAAQGGEGSLPAPASLAGGSASIKGQSGAGMVPMYLGRLISRPQSSHSVKARRFLQINSWIEGEMARPSRSPRADEQMFDFCWERRLLAAALIGYFCEPVRSVLVEGLTPNFCQAGVVAPPDSPGFGKTA